MNIFAALDTVDNKQKKRYFEWKFKLQQSKLTEFIFFDEERFLKFVQKKSFYSFLKWENTEEYRWLVSVMLQGRIGNDLLEIYEIVNKKAKKGDYKAIDMLLKLQQKIKASAKIKPNLDIAEKDENEDDDDLII